MGELRKLPHQHHASCSEGDPCWPKTVQRKRSVSVFGRSWSPSVIRFFMNHWLEIEALSDGQDEASAVRDLREYLRYEFDHPALSRQPVPCLCGARWFNPPKAVLGGASGGGRSFSDIVPSLEEAYEALPIAWQGRTKVYLMMLGHTEDEVYRMRERPQDKAGRSLKGSMSRFEVLHQQRMRSELRSPGFRARPQDQDEENESPWRRMAVSLGWTPREVEPEVEQQAA